MTDTYITKTGLKERGWTEKSIIQFLGCADKEKPNPHYKKASPMKLYLVERVENIEKSIEYQTFVSSNQGRITGAKKASITKYEKLMNIISKWEIVVPIFSEEEVTAKAIQAYRDFHIFDEVQTETFGHEFLQRISVNYIRHEMSTYDEKLIQLFGKVGKQDGYDLLNEKIYESIAVAYPNLRQECYRQLYRKLEIQSQKIART